MRKELLVSSGEAGDAIFIVRFGPQILHGPDGSNPRFRSRVFSGHAWRVGGPDLGSEGHSGDAREGKTWGQHTTCARIEE